MLSQSGQRCKSWTPQPQRKPKSATKPFWSLWNTRDSGQRFWSIVYITGIHCISENKPCETHVIHWSIKILWEFHTCPEEAVFLYVVLPLITPTPLIQQLKNYQTCCSWAALWMFYSLAYSLLCTSQKMLKSSAGQNSWSWGKFRLLMPCSGVQGWTEMDAWCCLLHWYSCSWEMSCRSTGPSPDTMSWWVSGPLIQEGAIALSAMISVNSPAAAKETEQGTPIQDDTNIILLHMRLPQSLKVVGATHLENYYKPPDRLML